jgi:hypothetical protein
MAPRAAFPKSLPVVKMDPDTTFYLNAIQGTKPMLIHADPDRDPGGETEPIPTT